MKKDTFRCPARQQRPVEILALRCLPLQISMRNHTFALELGRIQGRAHSLEHGVKGGSLQDVRSLPGFCPSIFARLPHNTHKLQVYIVLSMLRQMNSCKAVLTLCGFGLLASSRPDEDHSSLFGSSAVFLIALEKASIMVFRLLKGQSVFANIPFTVCVGCGRIRPGLASRIETKKKT